MSAAVEKNHSGQLRQPDHSQEGAQTRTSTGVYSPRVDIVETTDAYCMYAFMPGVKADGVSLHCKDGELVLHGRCSPRARGNRVLHQEYGIGDFYRTFVLNEQVDTSRIDAKIDNGVLLITLPKTERAKPKRITVKSS